MKKILFALAFVASTPLLAEVHSHKKVTLIHSGDTRGCIFFQLEGVPVADSNLPAGGAWFSVLHSHESSKQIFSMLLSAKAANSMVQVRTDGSSKCDKHAAVTSVIVE